jgi:hypothetical protein
MWGALPYREQIMKSISGCCIIPSLAMTMALAVAGCDEQTQRDVQEQTDRAQDKAAEALETSGEKVEQGWESIKTQWQTEMDDMERELAILKQDAAKFKDEQLDDSIAEADEKMREIGGRLRDAFPAEPVETLQTEVKRLLLEAKEAYERAKARLAELRSNENESEPGVGGGR